MQLQNNVHYQTGWGRKTAKGTFIAALVLVGGLVCSYSEAPKSAAYSIFREINKHSIAFQTRGWERVNGSHFEIRYRPEDAEIARLVLETAEMSVDPVNSRLGYVPQGKMLVLVYPTREALGKSFGWTADQSAMGVYWAGIIRILSPTAWIESAAATQLEEEFRSSGPMVHEYTHLVVDYVSRGNCPRWLTEGIAQHVERDVTGFILSDQMIRLEEQWFPLSEIDVQFDTPEGQSKAYRQSLAMIDYLTQEYGEEAYVGILHRLGRGSSLTAAWKAETGLSLEKFEQNFNYWTQAQADYEISEI